MCFGRIINLHIFQRSDSQDFLQKPSSSAPLSSAKLRNQTLRPFVAKVKRILRQQFDNKMSIQAHQDILKNNCPSDYSPQCPRAPTLKPFLSASTIEEDEPLMDSFELPEFSLKSRSSFSPHKQVESRQKISMLEFLHQKIKARKAKVQV